MLKNVCKIGRIRDVVVMNTVLFWSGDLFNFDVSSVIFNIVMMCEPLK